MKLLNNLKRNKMKQTVVDFLEEKLQGHLDISRRYWNELLVQAKQIQEKQLCDLVEQLKDYTLESNSVLGHDEREPKEFVEIFLNK
jgi:intergrase/recombinase